MPISRRIARRQCRDVLPLLRVCAAESEGTATVSAHERQEHGRFLLLPPGWSLRR
ncbi:MAG: hypothetical protein ABI690_25935 [Chloroflexota bacterium]